MAWEVRNLGLVKQDLREDLKNNARKLENGKVEITYRAVSHDTLSQTQRALCQLGMDVEIADFMHLADRDGDGKQEEEEIPNKNLIYAGHDYTVEVDKAEYDAAMKKIEDGKDDSEAEGCPKADEADCKKDSTPCEETEEDTSCEEEVSGKNCHRQTVDGEEKIVCDIVEDSKKTDDSTDSDDDADSSETNDKVIHGDASKGLGGPEYGASAVEAAAKVSAQDLKEGTFKFSGATDSAAIDKNATGATDKLYEKHADGDSLGEKNLRNFLSGDKKFEDLSESRQEDVAERAHHHGRFLEKYSDPAQEKDAERNLLLFSDDPAGNLKNTGEHYTAKDDKDQYKVQDADFKAAFPEMVKDDGSVDRDALLAAIEKAKTDSGLKDTDSVRNGQVTGAERRLTEALLAQDDQALLKASIDLMSGTTVTAAATVASNPFAERMKAQGLDTRPLYTADAAPAEVNGGSARFGGPYGGEAAKDYLALKYNDKIASDNKNAVPFRYYDPASSMGDDQQKVKEQIGDAKGAASAFQGFYDLDGNGKLDVSEFQQVFRNGRALDGTESTARYITEADDRAKAHAEFYENPGEGRTLEELQGGLVLLQDDPGGVFAQAREELLGNSDNVGIFGSKRAVYFPGIPDGGSLWGSGYCPLAYEMDKALEGFKQKNGGTALSLGSTMKADGQIDLTGFKFTDYLMVNHPELAKGLALYALDKATLSATFTP